MHIVFRILRTCLLGHLPADAQAVIIVQASEIEHMEALHMLGNIAWRQSNTTT